jgi:PEP-CTERM motif
MRFLTLILLLLFSAPTLSKAQIFFPPQEGFGDLAQTNVLSGIPGMGLLLIDYEFFNSPDALDVYFGTTPIFSSGPVSGSGQFSVAYGPGPSLPSPTLTILMNASGVAEPVTVWQYIPAVVPVPEPGVFCLAGLGVVALALRRRRLG